MPRISIIGVHTGPLVNARPASPLCISFDLEGRIATSRPSPSWVDCITSIGVLHDAQYFCALHRDSFRCGLIEPSLTLHRLWPYRSSNRTARRDPRSGCMPGPRPPSTLGRGDKWTMAGRRLSPYRSRASPTRKLPAGAAINKAFASAGGQQATT
jgi:hypothetical protein